MRVLPYPTLKDNPYTPLYGYRSVDTNSEGVNEVAKRTDAEINQLKRDWEADPCWDLYRTDGFEEHEEELRSYQEKKEQEWKEEFKQKAESLGLEGLYSMILSQQAEIERLSMRG